MIHDPHLIQASRDAFAPGPVDEAAEIAAAYDRAERFTRRLAAVAVALVLIAFALPILLRGCAS